MGILKGSLQNRYLKEETGAKEETKHQINNIKPKEKEWNMNVYLILGYCVECRGIS